MINTVIIDDEKIARFLLRDLIEKHFSDQILVVGEANDLESGIDIIKKSIPDLVFLDIKLQTATGFDLLDQIEHINFEVIFVTAYDKYAVEAFEFSAIGYLLKPIKLSKLASSIQRISESAKNTKKYDQLKVLTEHYQGENRIKRIVLSSIKGFFVVDVKDIIRLEAASNYTKFIMQNGEKNLTSRTIGKYEKLLEQHGFFRIHQSHIINLRHVKEFLKEDGGTVIMSDDSILGISRNRKSSFLDHFSD